MVCSHNSLWDSIFQLLIFNSWKKFRGRIIDLWYALVYCPFIYKAIFCFVLPTYPLPFLAKMGILEAGFMKQYRRHAFVLIGIVAAVITPPDLFTCFMVMMPMYGLYELSILIVGRVN